MKAAIISMLLVAGAAFPQSLPCPEKPRTRLETMLAQNSALILEGTSKIGEITSHRGGSLRIDCKEAKDPKSGKREIGLAIVILSKDNADQSHVAYIDYEEIGEITNALAFFAKVTPSSTSLEEYRAIYRTKGGLELSIHSIRIGEGFKVSYLDSCGARFSIYLSPEDVSAFQDLIAAASAKLAPNAK